MFCGCFCTLLTMSYKNSYRVCVCAGYQANMHLCFESLSLIYGGLHSFPGICFICLAQPRGSMLLSGTTEGKEANMRVSNSNFKAVGA